MRFSQTSGREGDVFNHPNTGKKRDELCRDLDDRIRTNGQKCESAGFIRCEEKCSKNLRSGGREAASPYGALVGGGNGGPPGTRPFTQVHPEADRARS